MPGTIGTIQATEALKLILNIGQPLIGRLMLYNALDMSFDFVTLKKNPNCKVCGVNPEISGLIDYEAFCGVPGHDHEEGSAGIDWDILPIELAQKIKDDDHVDFCDHRPRLKILAKTLNLHNDGSLADIFHITFCPNTTGREM